MECLCRRHLTEPVRLMLARDIATSQTLIFGLSQHRDESWERFVFLYSPLIHSWCRRLGLRQEDSDDLCQEVLIRINSSIDRFDPTVEGATFRGWLWTLVRNLVYDHFRRADQTPDGRGGTTGIQLMVAVPEHPPPHSAHDEEEFFLRLMAELRHEFKSSTWIAFWRIAVQGDSATDIADDLEISVWAVYKARTRVLARLKEELVSPQKYRELWSKQSFDAS
ncbi:sigma-70 family RNA polymerase sigma factor [Pirellulaceae bacterium SH449]